MSPVILLISGKQRSGKDTAAKLINTLTGNRFNIVSLATPIKIQYANLHGLTLEELDEAKNKYESVRRSLIELGAAMRQVDPHYWVKRAVSVPGNLIIPDCRFLNEIQFIEGLHPQSTFTVRVNATRETRSERGTLTNEDDASETELDFYNDWYFEIENNKGHQHLTYECEVVAEVLIPHLNRAII